jgi:hypothetical protein
MFSRVPYALRVASTMACGAIIPPAVAVGWFFLSAEKTETIDGTYTWYFKVKDADVGLDVGLGAGVDVGADAKKK